MQYDSLKISRRRLIQGAIAAAATASPAFAQTASTPFEQWVGAFHARAAARGISDKTYSRVMDNLKPDMSVFAQQRSQPEFNEQIWQYVNRRVSDWRLT